MPVAFKNCLEMVAEGGHFIAVAPANNQFGHGFFQFSPEMFYRVFNKANGFEVEEMIAVEYGPRHRWYRVADPVKTRARVTLVNSYVLNLFVRARRTRIVPIFEKIPQQSDAEEQ